MLVGLDNELVVVGGVGGLVVLDILVELVVVLVVLDGVGRGRREHFDAGLGESWNRDECHGGQVARLESSVSYLSVDEFHAESVAYSIFHVGESGVAVVALGDTKRHF